MRHVIYLLLVANLVFFGWYSLQLQEKDGMERSLPALPATATPLVTLQEMEQRQKQEQVSVPEPGQELDSSPDPENLDANETLAIVESLTRLQPPGGGGAITCRTLGPIMASVQLKALSSRLDELGLEPRHRTSEKQEAIGYWVYLPAMKYSEAQEIKGILDENNDKEYYIGKGNFIALGTFKEKHRADLRMRQAQKLELLPVLEPRYRIKTLHWLDIDRQTSNAVDLGEIMQDYPGIKLQEQACY